MFVFLIVAAISDSASSMNIKADSVFVDLSAQTVSCVYQDSVVWSALVSTGKEKRKTDRGRFEVVNKRKKTTSSVFGCNLFWWIGFEVKKRGLGFHAVTKKEQEELLGTKASFGCVRLSQEDAPILYDLVEIGTVIKVVSRLPLVYRPIRVDCSVGCYGVR